MEIVELTELQFKNYSNMHSRKNYKQSIEYAKLEETKGYKKLFLGLVDEQSNVHAATLILEKNLNGKYKYGYVPNGYLLNFFNINLLEIFTRELKEYLKKLNYIYIRLTPMMNYQIYDSNLILKENNNAIIHELKKLGYEYIPNPSKYKMFLTTNNINNTFQSFKRTLRRNINDCLKKGITVHMGMPNEIDEFLNLIDKKEYYKKMAEIYNNPNNKFEFYLAKINPETYINNYRYLLKKEQINNEQLNLKLKDPNIKKTNNLLNKKMTSDSLLTRYHSEIINGTNIYTTYPNGIVISAVGIIANKKDIIFVTEGYNNNFKNIRSIPMIKWEIIKKQLANNYKTFDLGHISIENTYTSKKGFNGDIIEYSNTFDLPINDMLYKINNFVKKEPK